MNGTKLLELFLDGAYFDSAERKFFHNSFRKGFRTMKSSNVSLMSAEDKLRKLGKHSYSNGITKSI